MYEQVAEAYIAGLEARAEQGLDVSGVASVASFFISRIDAAIDAELAERVERARSASERALARSLKGKVAIANAKLAYQRYKEFCGGARWAALAEKGAQTQRLLWASTSTKDPIYPDVMYVEELIGPDTVNTMPPSTFEAFRDHGRPKASLEDGLEEAHDTLETLSELGIRLEQHTDVLLEDGVRQFAEAFEKLLGAVEHTCSTAADPRRSRISCNLPRDVQAEVDAVIHDWQANGRVQQLWRGDASLWTGADEAEWLGWLGITEERFARADALNRIAEDVKAAKFNDALLLGMGGSSLCPEVLALTFGNRPGFPNLHVLDSTDPAQVRSFENRVDLGKTLFIVSSKSGSTLEPNIFKRYFFERVARLLGPEEAGRRFIAITDSGSKLEAIAEAEGFRHVINGLKSIGGRYSALSDFGMVPGAIIGVDVLELLDRADRMVQACASCVPVPENPGFLLGAIIGACAKRGRDKLTVVASPAVFGLGAWLEQLLAESTGKLGKGIIPVDREPLGSPEAYGGDRVFVYIRLDSDPDPEQDAAVEAFERSGQPVVRLSIADIYELGGQFFQWEFATAVAGSVIGINPFDQPDVEASKVATSKLTAEYERTGALSTETPILSTGEITLFTDDINASHIAAAQPASLEDYLKAHLIRAGTGDYVALLAYIEMTPEHETAITRIRKAIRDATKVATCVGFGPRFLHSTGQAYKGGPKSGVFLQITCDDAADLPVPGQNYTFGVVKAAQARGDFEVLTERRRRALRVHLGRDVAAGLATLSEAVDAAFRQGM